MKWCVFCMVFLIVSVQSAPIQDLDELDGNLVDVAESLGLTTLVKVAQKVDIARVLENGPNLTLFGPTNKAFTTIPDAIKPLLANTTILRGILLFHVIKSRVYANQIKNELLVPSILEQNPKLFIRFNVYDEVVTAQCSKIIKVNQNASNGVLHVVDSVMIPAIYTVSAMLSTYKQYYSTLVTALMKADLFEVLDGKGPFTVFAPTDYAFAKIPKDKLAKILADLPLLTKILKYHVVAGTVCSAGLHDGSSVVTLEGSDVTVHTTKHGVFINNAQVVYIDASTTNGVIHTIDTVLIPEDLEI